jgi:hypothetical protein
MTTARQQVDGGGCGGTVLVDDGGGKYDIACEEWEEFHGAGPYG